MSIARLQIDYNGNKVIVRVVRTKDKDRYDFNFTLAKAKVTITKKCEDLIDEEGNVDYGILRVEISRRIEEVYEMLME